MRANDELHLALAAGADVGHVVGVLVDAASVLFDALGLFGLFGLVVLGQEQHLLAPVHAHDGPRIAYVGHVAGITYDERDHGARAASIDLARLCQRLATCVVQEGGLRFSKGVLYSELRVLRKVGVFDYDLVQLVPEVVSTCGASVTVVNAEKGTSRPKLRVFEFRLDNVEND